MTYTATYELTDWLLPLTGEQVSFAATYRGLDDIVMCGKTKEITPYDNHNLGTATVCRVEKDKKPVVSVKGTNPGDNIEIYFNDGMLKATVTEKEEGGISF